MPPTLEFSSLPLIRVECAVHFTRTLALDFDRLVEIREALRPQLPSVAEFVGEAAPALPFGVIVGQAPGLVLTSPPPSITAAVRQDRIVVSWGKRGADDEYPRYVGMRDITLSIWQRVQAPAGAVTMTYVNNIPREHGQPGDLLVADSFPRTAEGRFLHDMSFSYRIGDETDFRLQIDRSDEGFLLTTTAGMGSSGDVAQELEQVHAALVTEFESKITARAKEVWGYADSRR